MPVPRVGEVVHQVGHGDVADVVDGDGLAVDGDCGGVGVPHPDLLVDVAAEK